MRVLIFLPALGAAVLVAAACGGAAVPATATTEAVRVTTTTPRKADVARRLEMAATVAPWAEATMYAKVAGYVKEIRVDRGSRVKRGELLAVLDVPEATIDVSRVEAELLHATTEIEQRRADLRLADSSLARLAAIRQEEPGAVSQQEVDVATGKRDAAQAAATTAESRLAVLKAELEEKRTLAGYARITAPFDGIVTERSVDVGALIAAGTSGKPSPIVRVVDAHKLRVLVDVPEPDVPYARVGNKATFTVDALPGEHFEGAVARRSDELDPSTRTMRVEIEVENADGKLLAGMFGRVRLDLETKKDVLAIDPRCLKLQKDKPYVFVVADGVAKRKDLRIGADDGVSIEVVAGLDASDRVVTSSSSPLADGQVCVEGTRREGT